VVGDLVAVEQEHGVTDVLLVDSNDLELRHQQLGQRDRRLLDLEAISERDLVAHTERVHEEVDLAAMVLVEVQPALMRMHRVEGDVGLVAGLLHDLIGLARPLLGHGEVEVLVGTVERGGQLGRVKAHRDPAEEPQLHTRLRGQPENALTLGDDVVEDRSHGRPQQL
jgi:hypothetical protein